MSLYRRIAERARESRLDDLFKVSEARVASAEENAKTLRDFLVHLGKQETESDGAT